ncbi:DHA2 family efflux MFS transporter permease subunit [Paenibacillus sp. J22TS3]|uniref:DHA2 family efflux MFS transporter permease subunit n=1 Tax=Paenibacillus sp. J22TS3 TaxID=2807192 RepID=UPI001B27F599|nr:DHA2 family efflux MFS transporter permease subunit [Paenibacillus sp. J22TS3]GIP24602.1 putative MFS-type transporter YcnB [Paenibacillus sp. J22TS3]
MKRKPVIIVASLIIANFLAQLMQTMLNTALPQMMLDLGIQVNRAQWLITVYLLVSGIVIPVTGFLIGKYSTRALFFASAGAFTTGTLIAGFSADFVLILSGRIIQGIGAGLLVPVFLNTIIMVFPKEKLGAAMGLASLIVGLAPALGPTISGFVIQNHSWRILFYGVAPVAIANLFVAYYGLENVWDTHKAKLDWRSILYSSLGFGSLLYGFSILGDQGRGLLLAMAILLVGFVMSFLFVKRQFKLAVPLLDFNVFRYSRFTYASIIGVVLFIVMAGVELLLPIYAQNVRGLTPRESGVMLLPGALLMGVSGIIAGKIYDRFGGRYLIRSAFFGIAAVTALLTIALSVHASYKILIGLYALLMTGVGFMMTPITAFAMASLPGSMMKYASPMTTAIRTLGMSMGGALLITMVTITADYSQVSFPFYMHEGIQAAFWSLTLAAVGGFILTFFVPYATGSAEPQAMESRQAS